MPIFSGEQQIEKRNGKFLNGFRASQKYTRFFWTLGGAVLVFKAYADRNCVGPFSLEPYS